FHCLILHFGSPSRGDDMDPVSDSLSASRLHNSHNPRRCSLAGDLSVRRVKSETGFPSHPGNSPTSSGTLRRADRTKHSAPSNSTASDSDFRKEDPMIRQNLALGIRRSHRLRKRDQRRSQNGGPRSFLFRGGLYLRGLGSILNCSGSDRGRVPSARPPSSSRTCEARRSPRSYSEAAGWHRDRCSSLLRSLPRGSIIYHTCPRGLYRRNWRSEGGHRICVARHDIALVSDVARSRFACGHSRYPSSKALEPIMNDSASIGSLS